MKKYNWYRMEEEEIPGTEDWDEVAEYSTHMGYDWEKLRVYYSPSARRYFWFSATGCSCKDWEDCVNRLDDFKNGDKQAAIKAAKAWHGELDEYGKKSSNFDINKLIDYRERQ